MNALVTHRRVAAGAAALAIAVSPLATVFAAPAQASRTAATAVDTTYLQDALGLPADTIVETVTYDRFQWLLQQPGQLAFVVGSVADTDFPAKVRAAEAAARTAGAKKVYWFDPNLSGQTGAGSLDTRKPAQIGTLAPVSQAIYGNVWNSVVAQYLGDGLKATVTDEYSESAVVTTAPDDSVVNDAVDPIWDYRSTATQPAVGAGEDVFFVYDKDHRSGADADKVVDWVDLSSATATEIGTEVPAALAAAGGAAAIDQLGQFAFWKDEVNEKHAEQAPNTAADPNRYGSDVLDDADAADGWRVEQITYPELVHLLDVKDSASKNFVILFGGTWCPNTRAVIKDINRQAQDNDVTVYNFDTVLDGGTVGGATTSARNPLQIRNTVNNGTTTSNANPSFLYANLLNTYFKNIITQYDLNNGSYVTYYPNGNTAQPVAAVRKLQVPFLVSYQRGDGGSPSTTAIKRQWIQQNIDPSTGLPSFKEYMSQWWYTHPAGTRLGLTQVFTSPASPGYPADLPFPASPAAAQAAPDSAFLDAADAGRSDADKALIAKARRSSVTTALAGRDFGQEAVAKLASFFGGLPGAVVSRQTVTAPAVGYGTAPRVTLAIANDYGRIPSGNATLTIAGTSYVAKVAQNSATFALPKLAPGSYAYTVGYAGDDQVVGFQRTGTLTVAKGAVLKTTGALVKAPTSKKAGRYKVLVDTPSGLSRATGKVTLKLAKGGARKTVTGTLKAGSVTVALPKLAKGTWTVRVSYAGDLDYVAATGTGTAVKVKK